MNVGILGCGVVADLHLPHLVNNPRFRSVSIADQDPEKAARTARRYGITDVYPGLEEMLRRPLDAVHILTPPAAHCKLAVQAMQAGCHVLVEKPMALSAAEAGAMLAAAQRNGVKLGVDFNFLMSPLVQRISALVEGGELGRLIHVETQYNFDIRRSANLNRTINGQVDWAFRLPLGPLADHLPHPASILLHFLPDPLQIWAVARQNGLLPDGLPDELRVLVDSPRATGLLSVSFGSRPDTIMVNVYGTRASLHANLSNMTLTLRADKNVPKKMLRLVDSLDQSFQLFSGAFSSAWQVLRKKASPPGDVGPVIQAFYDHIEHGADLPASGEAGQRVTLFMEQIAGQVMGPESAAVLEARGPQPSSGLQADRPAAAPAPEILVTGGTGFLGSHLVNRLVQQGRSVRVLARKMNRLEHLPPAGVEVVYGDLRDRESLRRALQGIKIVVHAGAAMAGSWEEYEETTIRGTQHLLELSLAAGVQRFVHISSLTVFQLSGHPRNAVITEDSPCERDPETVGAYAYTKLVSEKLALEYHKKGLPVVVLRPGVIYGPRGPVIFPHAGFTLLDRLIVMVGRGTNLIPLTFVDNTVDAILLAMQQDQAVGEVFTVVDDGEITQREYLRRCRQATGDPRPVVPVPFAFFLLPVGMIRLAARLGLIRKKHLPSRYALASKYYSLRFSSEKARRLLGWQPQVSLEEGLRRTFEWYNQTRRQPPDGLKTAAHRPAASDHLTPEVESR